MPSDRNHPGEAKRLFELYAGVTMPSAVGQRACSRSENAPASGLPTVSPFGSRILEDIRGRLHEPICDSIEHRFRSADVQLNGVLTQACLQAIHLAAQRLQACLLQIAFVSS